MVLLIILLLVLCHRVGIADIFHFMLRFDGVLVCVVIAVMYESSGVRGCIGFGSCGDRVDVGVTCGVVISVVLCVSLMSLSSLVSLYLLLHISMLIIVFVLLLLLVLLLL